MIGEADQHMLCSVDTFKASCAERLIEPERGPCMFIFGKNSGMGSDECTQASKQIPPSGDIGITLHRGGITEVGNHGAQTDSCIRLERAPRIPCKKVNPNSGHSQMD